MFPIFLWVGGILHDRLIFETKWFVCVEYICVYDRGTRLLIEALILTAKDWKQFCPFKGDLLNYDISKNTKCYVIVEKKASIVCGDKNSRVCCYVWKDYV